MSSKAGNPSLLDNPPEGSGWRLRPVRPDDEAGIVASFEQANSRALTAEAWRWKLGKPAGSAATAWVAVDGAERPICHYAGIPCRLRLPAGVFDALVAVDAWTVPEFRRQGIFTRCAEWIHEYWRRAGFVGLLGAPNEQWGSRGRLLGWRPLFPLKWQIRPLRPEAIVARRLRLPAVGRLGIFSSAWNGLWAIRSGSRQKGASAIEVRELAGEPMEDLPRSDPSSWGLERGADRVRWRYLDCPLHDYRTLIARHQGRDAGYAVFRLAEDQGRRFAFVAELGCAASEPQVRGALITEIVSRAKAAGADAIATLAVPSTDAYGAWRRHGFVFSWGSFGIHCRPFNQAMDPAVLREPSRWDMVGGDLDVI